MEGLSEAAPLEPVSPRRIWQIAGGLTLFGLALRLWGLGDESFWADEGWTWWAVRGSLGQTIDGARNADFHPPLYYLFMWGWSRLGDSEAWLRLPSVIFGAAAIPLVFRLAHRNFGWTAGWGAALLYALSGNATYFSQEARSYSLLVLETLAAANLLDSAVRGRAVWLGFALGLIGLTHYIGGFFAAVAGIWLLRRREIRTLIIAGIVGAVTFSPWAPTFLYQLGRASAGFWIPLPTPREIANLFLEWALFPHYAPAVPRFVMGLSAVVLLIAAAGGAWWSRNRPPGRFLILWATLPIAISIVTSLRVSIFYPRSLSYVLPAWILLAVAWPGRLFRPALTALALTFVVAQGVMHFSVQKENWREAVAFTKAQSEVPCAFWPGDLEAPGTYYLRHRTVPATLIRLPADDRLDHVGQREELGRLLDANGPERVWLFTRYNRKHVGQGDFAKFQLVFMPAGVEDEFRSVRVELWIRRSVPLKAGKGDASPGGADRRCRSTLPASRSGA